MEKVASEKELIVDYKGLFQDWTGPLNQLLSSNYMYNLMVFLDRAYKCEKGMLPSDKSDVFRAFRATPFFGLKVVIISDEPHNMDINNGLALGVNDTVLNPPIVSKKIRNCIERDSKDFRLEFDYSMYSWAQQGVLMLNASLTTKFLDPSSHHLYWKNFTREVVKSINLRKENVVFILLGNRAKYYKRYVNQDKNYVLECKHPKESVYNNQVWDSPVFKYANDIIRNKKGEKACVEW